MKHCYKYLVAPAIALLPVLVHPVHAGNEDRVGQAGASELLINPFARSSGWAGANTALARGLESQFQNVAGLAFIKKTEIVFAHTRWLSGTDISINAFGLSQAVGKDKTGTLGLGVTSMSFGDIPVTTVDNPEGGIGTYSPTFTNIAVSYAKEFSNSIFGGVTVRIINERISDVNASGVCFDAGIQYIAGKKENIRFGISLRNVGPRLQFRGDGLSIRGSLPLTGASLMMQQRNESFEMPSLLNIGGAYIFDLGEKHQITAALNFNSNSFSKDQFHGGVEYAFNKMFMIRGGYMQEMGAPGTENQFIRTTAITGPTAGFTVEAPLNKNGTTFSIDYSYRSTNPFSGVHTIGARINL